MTGPEFAAGAAMIKIFQWAWDQFGKEITQSATGALQKQWKSFQYKAAAQAYAQKMKKRYGQMQLWKMSAPASVEDIFTRVNILGKPGAGKTTFLKHITLQAIKGEIDAVPIFVSLQELSDAQESLMDFIVKQFDICGFPEARPFIEKLLKAGKAIVLFDGLDEVNTEQGQRDKQIQALKDFSDKYDRSQVVITCRVAATEYNFQGFTYVEMADFDDDQIKTFVRLWFSEDAKKSALFLAAFEEHQGERLRDLAKNPLLLTLLCIGFEETLHFPERRSEIYGEALNTLLKARDRSENIERDEIYRSLSLGRKKRMFTLIAANAFEMTTFSKKTVSKNRL